MSYISKISAFAAAALFLATAAIAESITPNEAYSHVGTQQTVVGVVSQVSESPGGTRFVNFGGRYPNHVFYGVILERRTHRFPDVFDLEDQTIAISGTIELYKGKPQIILISADQIEMR